jgi:hypothetical protein
VPEGNLVIQRKVLMDDDVPQWKMSAKKIKSVKVVGEGTIEDSISPLHADFANQFIGGKTPNFEIL